MIGRTPGSIVAVRPLKDGVIADFDITATMLKHFIRQATKSSSFGRPHIVVLHSFRRYRSRTPCC